MPRDTVDAPGVIVFPPVIGIGTILAGVVLDVLWPLGWLSSYAMLPLRIAGLHMFAIGLLMLLAAARALRKLGTNINPSQPATALADFGVFGLTRNPMYVGGSLMMLALALFFANDWLLILFVPSQLLLYYGVIRPEERYLAGKFGERYRQYAGRAPRYFGVF